MVDFPTTLVPTDVAALTTALGNVTKNHTDHHQAVDERLGLYEDLLSPDGFFLHLQADVGQTDPLLDLQDSDGNDRWYFEFPDATSAYVKLVGPDETKLAIADAVFDTATARNANSVYTAYADDGLANANIDFSATINKDGTNALTAISFVTSTGGSAYINASATVADLEVYEAPGQTEPILILGSVVEILPDGSVGGVAPSNGWSIKWNAGAGKWVAAA